MERIVTNIEPIRDMQAHTSEGYDRVVNEAIAGMSPVEQDDLVGQEQRRMAVDQTISRTFNERVDGCTDDCWLRAVISQRGPNFKTYCLPDGIMKSLPEDVQAEICAERHATARSEFDLFVAPTVNPVD